MATVPAFADGTVVHQADLAFCLSGRPFAQIVQGTAQSIPNTTYTDVTFDAESVDRDSMHDTSSLTARLILGKTLGYWWVSYNIVFSPNATGIRRACLASNGVAIAGAQVGAMSSGSGEPFALSSTYIYQSTTSTDYVTVQAYQSSGAALNTQVGLTYRSTLSAFYLGTP